MNNKPEFKGFGVVRGSDRKLDRRQQLIASNIRRLWHEKQAREPGLTQAKASKLLGWSHSVVGQYISGRVPAGPKAVFKFAEYFGVTPYDIDPDLRNEFAEPPAVNDLRTTLAKLDPSDALKVINLVARRMPQRELLYAIEALAGMAADRA